MPDERRLPPALRERLAAYRTDALAETPASEAMVRKFVVLGRAAYALALDEVPGVFWSRLSDHGERGVIMPAGQAHLEVWGGDPAEVFSHVAERRPAGVTITVRWHRARWWHRVLAWLSWRWWLMFVDRRRRGP